MRIQELLTLGNTLLILGIVFGCGDRLIGYSFIGAGVLLSIIGGFKLRREQKVQTHRTGGA
jgi:hypothetical protein